MTMLQQNIARLEAPLVGTGTKQKHKRFNNVNEGVNVI